jgi:hypothetical protein
MTLRRAACALFYILLTSCAPARQLAPMPMASEAQQTSSLQPPFGPPPPDGRTPQSPPPPLGGYPHGSPALPCSAPPAPSPTPTPLRTAPIISITARNLAGYWYGSEVEMVAGAITNCDLEPHRILKLTQQNNMLLGKAIFGAYVGWGVFSGEEEFTATIGDGIVDVTEVTHYAVPTTFRYRLMFDPASQHLVGVRNGVRIWLIPFVFSDTCPSPYRNPCEPIAVS